MLHILARAVIIAEQHLLVAKAVGASNTFLPGGHVEVGESMPTTLERELLEEVGLAVKVERYLGAIEHSYGSPEEYEINHVFVVKCEYEPLASKEAHLEFLWLPVERLQANNLLPSPAIQLIQHYLEGKEGSFWASTFAP